MNVSSQSQLWLATLGAAVSLAAAVIPATIQLFDDPPSPQTATTPIETISTPAAAPPSPTPALELPPDDGRDRGSRRGGDRQDGRGES